MGNLKKCSFERLSISQKADEIRNKVKNCKEDCWMVDSITPVIRKKFGFQPGGLLNISFLGRKYA